jgi:hypothetical protein
MATSARVRSVFSLLAISNQAGVTFGIVHPVAVDQIERRGLSDRLATAGANVSRHPLAMRHVPPVSQFDESQSLGLSPVTAAIELPDRRTFLEQLAPEFVVDRLGVGRSRIDRVGVRRKRPKRRNPSCGESFGAALNQSVAFVAFVAYVAPGSLSRGPLDETEKLGPLPLYPSSSRSGRTRRDRIVIRRAVFKGHGRSAP